MRTCSHPPRTARRRFIAGRAPLVFRLAELPTRFARQFRALGNQSWPEKHILALVAAASGAETRAAARAAGKPARRGKRLARFDEYAVLGRLRTNRAKYHRERISTAASL